MISTLIHENGIAWIVNRSLYLLKINILKLAPITEFIFEKNVKIHNVDVFDLNVEAIQEFILNLSEEDKTNLVYSADQAIKGRIKAFSSLDLDYGDPIKWHYSPITKTETNKGKKWYKIPDFDLIRGDIKVIWEASRFTHFYLFARAYLLTEDIKYYEAFSNQLKSWLSENQYPYGANFKCGQECALRMINTLLVFSVFRAKRVTSEEDKNNVEELVRRCYKKILSNFFYAHKCIKNNHTLSEICGMMTGALCSSDEHKFKKFVELWDQEVSKQFDTDGGYRQKSFNYQRFALQLSEYADLITHKTSTKMSNGSRNRIIQSAMLMYSLQAEHGDVPNYGPNDGALIFPVSYCGYRDFTPVINTVVAQAHGNVIYVHGDHEEELLWFCGRKDYPQKTTQKLSKSFPFAGLYSIRHKDGFLMICLNNFRSRPAHMDQLHIDLWHKGVNVFCDSGTYSYASELGRKLSLTTAHNTAKVEGLEQMDKKGAFLVYNWTKRENVTFKDGYFEGTMTSKKGYRHTRKVVRTPKGYTIDDHVAGKASKVEYLFHTPCDFSIASNRVMLFNEGSHICTLIAQEESQIEIRKASRSLFYLKEETINVISIKKDLVGGEDKNIAEILLEE